MFIKELNFVKDTKNFGKNAAPLRIPMRKTCANSLKHLSQRKKTSITYRPLSRPPRRQAHLHSALKQHI